MGNIFLGNLLLKQVLKPGGRRGGSEDPQLSFVFFMTPSISLLLQLRTKNKITKPCRTKRKENKHKICA